MSEPKLNIKEETSTKKTRSPPKKAKVEQSVPRKKKLKTDAEDLAVLVPFLPCILAFFFSFRA